MGALSATRLCYLAVLVELTCAVSYNLVKDYSGPTFFDDWNFYDHFDDKMNGDVNFVSAANASSQRLAYVDPATNRAIMRVDNTTFVPFNEKRSSVRINTKQTYGIGSVWVADIWHAPYGCSVWPAWWSFAPDATWPAGGEIDIFEGINLAPSSQMGLHTTPGCTQVSPSQTSRLVNSTDCQGAQGCITTNDNPNGYGPAFATAGGGIFVTELAATGVSIWFFSRANIPDVLKSSTNAIDTSGLGTPMGNWPAGGCDISRFFMPQTLVFDITLCGDFANGPNLFAQTCPGTCYNDYVINNGTTQYANAYFEVEYVRVYSSSANATSSGTGASNGSGASDTNSASNANSSGGGTNSAMPLMRPGLAAIVSGIGLLMVAGVVL